MNANELFERAVERRRANDLPAALSLLREAGAQARRQGRQRLLAQIEGELGWVLTHAGDPEAAVDSYTAAADAACAAGDNAGHVMWLISLVGALGGAGRLAEARERIPAVRESAAATGVPKLITDAAMQHSSILATEQRYAEAVEILEQVESLTEPARSPLLRSNKALMLAKWGLELHAEGQLAQARKRLEDAVQLLDTDVVEEANFALHAYQVLVEINENLNDIQARHRAARALEALARQTGRDSLAEAAAKEAVVVGDSLRLADGDDRAQIEIYERELSHALLAGDLSAEARARTNLAIVRLTWSDEQAWRDLELALTAVSRCGDRRSEFLLSAAFSYPALARGERQRAIQFAERAVELAREGPPLQRGLAALIRGSVTLDAVGDVAAAKADYWTAVNELQTVGNVQDALPGFALQHLLRMAATSDPALQAATAQIMGVPTPETSVSGIVPSLEELRTEHDDDLDVALAAWTGSATPTGPGADERLAAMRRMADASRWPEAAYRLSNAVRIAPVGHLSAGGPAGLLRLSERVAERTVAEDDAAAAVRALAVPADILAGTCLFAISCRQAAPPNVALLRMAFAETDDEVLAARLCWLLISYAQAYGDQEQAHHWAETGIQRLTGRSDEPLLVYLLNESSAVLQHLGRPAQVLERAQETIRQADQLGNTEFGDLGRRNRAMALIALDRLAEAEQHLLALDAEQLSRGDLAGCKITRLDLARLRAHRGAAEPIDVDDNDAEGIFTNAITLVRRGDLGSAIAEFRRGFAALERTGDRNDGEAGHRSNFANVLWEAGDRDEAVTQMERAAQAFDSAGEVAKACESYTALAVSLLTEPDVARAYARRAVAAAERIGPGRALAQALAALGSAELAALKPSEALEPLSRAAEMDQSADILGTYVQALTACGRAAEAVEFLEAELRRPQSTEPRALAGLLAALGAAARKLGRREYALSSSAAAYDIARHLPPDALTASIADAYAVELSSAGFRARAATILEDARAAVRDARYTDLEEQLMASLGSILRELGDYQGAERILSEVCERRRPRGRDRVLAQSLYALGTVLLSRGDHRAALDLLYEALAVAEAAGDAHTQASALDTIGFAHTESGRPQRAVEYHRSAATLHASLGSYEHEVLDRCGLVHTLVMLGDALAARTELDAALELHARAPSGLSIDHVAAQVYALEGDWKTADGLFRSALDGVTSAYRVDTPAEARTRAGLHDRVLREATRAAVTAGDARAALTYAEACRARYQQAVIDRRGSRPPDVGEDEWREYEAAADNVAEARAQRRSAGFASAGLDETYHQALRRLEAVSAAVFEDGHTTRAPAQAKLPEFDDLVNLVPPGSAVVCLGAGPEGLTVIRAGRSADGVPWADCRSCPSFTVAELEKLLFDPEGWVAAWSDSGEDPSDEELHALVTRVCAKLSELVWPSVIDGLAPDCRMVLLMPMGGLAALPLHAAALLTGGEARVSVQYAPSLRVLAVDHPVHDVAPGILGQVVDPLGDLPFSRCEALTIAQRHAGTQRALRGPDATITNVIELLRIADIVQLAGHATFDVEDPLRSNISCAAGDRTTEPLTISALLRETGAIRSRMVMLSACESGRLDADDPLDEQIGLAGVLVAVGARNVLAAQWPVDDLVAALVATEFFARWNYGQVPAAAALSQTQVWLRDEVTVAHVRARLDAWARLAPGDADIEERRQEWAKPIDPDRRPFKSPLDWAPFHIVGAL